MVVATDQRPEDYPEGPFKLDVEDMLSRNNGNSHNNYNKIKVMKSNTKIKIEIE